MNAEFLKKLEEIIARDNRYKPDAYEFLLQALWFTQKKLVRTGHVSGKELLAGIRDFGLEQYGPMAKTVFAHWGVQATSDFGEMVFNMVEQGLMSKTDSDTREDFKDVYDFDKELDVFKVKG